MTTLNDLAAALTYYQTLGKGISVSSAYVAQLRAAANPQDIATAGLLDQLDQAFTNLEQAWTTINTQLQGVQIDAQNDAAEIANVKSQLAAAGGSPPALPPAPSAPTPAPPQAAAQPGTGYTGMQIGGAAFASFVLGLGAGKLMFDGKRTSR